MKNATSGTNVVRRAGLVAIVMALMFTARDVGAVERKGFIFGLGLGGGKMACDGCESLSRLAVGLHLGGMINEKLALVWDSSGVVKEQDGVTISSAEFAALSCLPWRT